MRLQGSRTFGHRRLACRPALERLEDRTVPSSGWGNFAHDPQHTGLSTVASQPLDRIDWQTPVDQGPVFFSHYGVPVITAENTVIYPVAVNSDNDRARRHGVRHQRRHPVRDRRIAQIHPDRHGFAGSGRTGTIGVVHRHRETDQERSRANGDDRFRGRFHRFGQDQFGQRPSFLHNRFPSIGQPLHYRPV